MISLYSSADVYTAQLRKLEAFVGANPRSTSGHFVLAYHYLTQGHVEPAVSQLEQVVALAPQDTLSAQLIKQFGKPASVSDASKPAPAPATTQAPVEAGKLPGKWAANPTKDTVIQLELADDAAFTWSVDSKGHAQRIDGKWSLADDMLTLAQSGQGGALVGRVTWQAANRWNFRVIGSGPEDPGLSFTH
jgi:hypothetical protein